MNPSDRLGPGERRHLSSRGSRERRLPDAGRSSAATGSSHEQRQVRRRSELSRAFSLLAELPVLQSSMRAGSAQRALNIGLGSGVTLSRLAELPVQRIDSVELSEGILEANRRFLSPDLFAGLRGSRHVLADGRNYLLGERGRGATTSSSSAPPGRWSSRPPGLLTDEFFALASKRLAPGWNDRDLAGSLLRARRRHRRRFSDLPPRSFPHATAWTTEDAEIRPDRVTPSPLRVSEQEIAECVVSPRARSRRGVSGWVRSR